jgi:hypothetical protein
MGQPASWSGQRARLHALQHGQFAFPRRTAQQQTPPEDVLTQFVDVAADGYLAAFPDADLVTFSVGAIGFLFDHSLTAERASRTVAAWTRAGPAPVDRDRSRQAGFPIPAALAEAGYERGHLIAHATGGGLDANIFAQARHVNQGWSPDGCRYRQLERLAATNPGCLVMHRLIYGDDTDVPDLNELTVILDGQVHHGTFDNRPSAWISAIERLNRGRRFHQIVQTAFLTGLAGASACPEHQLRLTRTSRGRVDIHVVPDIGERYAVVIEIKSTDWDAQREHRVRPNLRAHIRQLQGYLDRYVEDIGAVAGNGDDLAGASGGPWDSISGILLYPRRPTDIARLQLIDDLNSREAITVAWYDETDWTTRPPAGRAPAP